MPPGEGSLCNYTLPCSCHMILVYIHWFRCSQPKEQLYDDVHHYYLVNYKANKRYADATLGSAMSVRCVFAVQLLGKCILWFCIS